MSTAFTEGSLTSLEKTYCLEILYSLAKYHWFSLTHENNNVYDRKSPDFHQVPILSSLVGSISPSEHSNTIFACKILLLLCQYPKVSSSLHGQGIESNLLAFLASASTTEGFRRFFHFIHCCFNT